jgi:hypothetical protein
MNCIKCGKSITPGNEIMHEGEAIGPKCAAKMGLYINFENMQKLALSPAKITEIICKNAVKHGTGYSPSFDENDDPEKFKIWDETKSISIDVSTKEMFGPEFDSGTLAIDYPVINPLIKEFWMNRRCADMEVVLPDNTRSEEEFFKLRNEDLDPNDPDDAEEMVYTLPLSFEERKERAVRAFCGIFHDPALSEIHAERLMIMTLDIVAVLPSTSEFQSRFIVRSCHTDADKSKFIQIKIKDPKFREDNYDHICLDYLQEINGKTKCLLSSDGQPISTIFDRAIERSDREAYEHSPETAIFNQFAEWFFSDIGGTNLTSDDFKDTHIGARRPFVWLTDDD